MTTSSFERLGKDNLSPICRDASLRLFGNSAWIPSCATPKTELPIACRFLAGEFLSRKMNCAESVLFARFNLRKERICLVGPEMKVFHKIHRQGLNTFEVKIDSRCKLLGLLCTDQVFDFL